MLRLSIVSPSYDAISKLKVEDGALSNIASLLDRALTLAAQSASDTFPGSRSTLNSEFQSVISGISRNATAAGLDSANSNLNTRSVFVGNTSTSTSASVSYVSFSVASTTDLAVHADQIEDVQTQEVADSALNGAEAARLGIDELGITTQALAAAAVSAIRTAIVTLGDFQGRVGSAMNRLSFAIAQAKSMSVSVQASESRIRDANIAEEAAALTKFNILTESGLSALAQANQASQSVLQLLR